MSSVYRLVGFVDQLHPHHMLGSNVNLAMTANCCYTVLGYILFVNWRQHSPAFSESLKIQLDASFCEVTKRIWHLLLNAPAGYCDVSPYVCRPYHSSKVYTPALIRKGNQLRDTKKYSIYYVIKTGWLTP